jgi:hypothetical protein
MIINCEQCNKEFKTYPSKLKRNKHNFCCKACGYIWKSENLKGKNNPLYSKEEIECTWCGKKIYREPWQLKTFDHHFCDVVCKGKWHSKNFSKQNHINYNSTTVECSYCHKPLKVTAGINKKFDHHFCDNKCKGEWNSINRTGEKSPRWKGGTVLKNKRRYDKLVSTSYGRISNRIHSALWRSLKGNKNGRSWEMLVGYTCTDLKKHLENLFSDGMTWENMGKWHIDHIIPKSLFNYETEEDEEFKKCWALSNLQPLWAIDNLRKSNKLFGAAAQF